MKASKILLACLVLAVLVVAVMFITGYLKNPFKPAATVTAGPTLVEKDKLVIGMYVGYVSKSYPAEAIPSDQEVYHYGQVYEPLARADKNRRFIQGSGLASSWTNPDLLTWRFVINPNAKFSDGTPVLASDIKFTYDTIIKNEYQIASLYPPIKEMKAVDAKTLDIITPTLNPTLVNKLTSLMVLSEKDVTKNGLTNPIGSGPYTLIAPDATKGESRHYVRNENYWGAIPKLKEVVMKEITPLESETASESLYAALQAGDIDLAGVSYNKESINKLTATGNYKLATTSDGTIQFIAINTLKSSPLQNLKVRQALRYAFNLKELQTVNPEETLVPASQIVANSIFGYNPDIPFPVYDLTKAQALVKEANLGSDNKITVINAIETEGFKTIVAQFNKTGLDVKLQIAVGDDYMNRLTSSDFEMIYGAFSVTSGDASEALEQLYYTRGESLGVYNLGYSNEAVDALIDKAANTMDTKTRQSYFQQALKIITIDDVAYIPLGSGIGRAIYPKDLYWEPRSDGNIVFSELAGLSQ